MKFRESKHPVRLLYLPNESANAYQTGPRNAFEELITDHVLDDYKVFSFLLEAQSTVTFEQWSKNLLRVINDFQPTVIFWQHVSNFPVDQELMIQLKNSPSKPFLVYHEGDIYGKIRKRLTPSMKLLAKNSDMIFLVGLGENAELFRNAGAKRIFYTPHCFDTTRFGHDWNWKTQKRSGVVMIANQINSTPFTRWLPPLRFPGSLEREQLAINLYKKFGDRFKLYGRGWGKFPFCDGIISYDEQEKILRQHLISANWDHFPETPFYFSDRLPISMISGVAHTTNYHPGYELMFKNGEDLVYYRTVQDAVDIIDWMLCQPINYLIDMGRAGEVFARNNLTTLIVYKRMIELIKNEMTSIYFSKKYDK